MVVRRQNNTIPRHYLVNAGVTIFFVATAAMMVRASFTHETVSACSDRYSSQTRLGLRDQNRRVVSPIELQSQLGGGDWGLFSNLEIREAEGPGVDAAMEVLLTGTERGTLRDQASGVGFEWTTNFLEGRKSGCLSYKVFLAENFSFDKSGTLPGLRAREIGAGEPTATNDVILPVRWYREGQPGIQVRRPIRGIPTETKVEPRGLYLTQGRWIQIDQEVVLNDVGKDNGELRLWIDGTLAVERGGMTMLKSEQPLHFTSVVANVHYIESSVHWAAPAESTSLKISDLKLFRE